MKKIYLFALIALCCPFLSLTTGVAESPSDNDFNSLSARNSNLSSDFIAARDAWVDSVMNTLDLDGRIAQLFVPRLDITDNEQGKKLLRSVVADSKVGGFLLGKGTVNGYASLIRYAQGLADIPLLITLDGEWGPAMRITDDPRFPYNMALGAIQDEKLLYEYGLEVARQCKEIGINVNFAPVLDVNSNPRNPVIGYRSFGDNPQNVSKLGVAYSKGLEDGGVLSVAKHFPGHGDTSEDSHHTLPSVSHSLAQINEIDLPPFVDYINSGLSGIMIAHLLVPAVDSSGLPASLSTAVSTELLKNRLGFQGLVFTDALAMKGAKAKAGENNSLSALKAGADVLLQPLSLTEDIKAIKNAVLSGQISSERIDASCRKILRYKYQLGLNDFSLPPVASVKSKVVDSKALVVRQKLADALITVLYDTDRLLPVNKLSSRDIAVVNIGAPASNSFSDMCAKYAKVSKFSVQGAEISSSQLTDIRKADIVIIGVYSDAVWAVNSYRKLAALKGAVPVFFINPYKMTKFGQLKDSKVLVAAYDDTPEILSSAAQALFGGIDVVGRFPVDIPSIASQGGGISVPKSRLAYSSPASMGFNDRLEAVVDSIAMLAVRRGAAPGCQVLIARNGTVVLDKSYGKLEKGGTDVNSETLYDIASMTKATATIGGVMKAYDEGLFSIDDKASRFIPGLEKTDKENLKIRELMFHESGMPAIVSVMKIMMDPDSYSGPLTKSRSGGDYTVKIQNGVFGNASAKMRSDIVSRTQSDENDIQIAKGIFGGEALRDTLMNRIYQAPLKASKSYRYSCLNYCLLMEMEENLTGVDHDQWVETEIFAPLGAWHTGFRPTEYYPLENIAPTEQDNFLRKQLVRGFVHDEIAAFSGGVQGNAGLFSTAGDVAKYAQMLLQKGAYGGECILSPATVDKFTRTKNAKGTRTLGFDILKGFRGDGEDTFGEAFGHTGFTGTCFWIDPEENIIFVFLSNRINPSRDNPAFTSVNPRGQIIKAIYANLAD